MIANAFAGQVAVITGAAGGLGRTFALAFSAAGARVVLADRNADGVGGKSDPPSAPAVDLGQPAPSDSASSSETQPAPSQSENK